MPQIVPPPVLESAYLAEAGFDHGFTTRGASLHGRPGEPGLFGPNALYMVTQVHGSEVVVAEGDVDTFRSRKADAIVVTGSHAGAIRVADCVPVLIGDTKTGKAAAIHAGWRGVVSGVIPAALAAMAVRPTSLVAAIGPCIEACCFEVGEEVAEAMSFAVPAPGVEARRGAGKVWLDLVVAVRAQLAACGVPLDRIERVGGCTKCDAVRYESYRRDGAASGRMTAAIAAHEALTS